MSHVALEYSTVELYFHCTADLESQKYSLGEVVEGYEDSEATVSTSSMYNRMYDIERYGIEYGSTWIDEFPNDQIWYDTNFKMIRISGEIYTYNK